jgi:hydrogenase maturation protease
LTGVVGDRLDFADDRLAHVCEQAVAIRSVYLVRDPFPAPRGRAALRAAAVCLGSPYRGDDAVGPEAARRLRGAGATVLDCADEPTRLLHEWAGLDVVVLVDGHDRRAAGTGIGSTRAMARSADLRLASTHALGVAEVLGSSRALGRAPRRVVVLGIEAGPSGWATA